jgi:hypothetical protein
MAQKPALSVVTDAMSPRTPEKPKTLVEAVAGGDYREILMAQQREIAATVGEEKGPAKAALHRQLALISKEIQSLDAAEDEGEAVAGDNPDDERFDASAL